MKSVKILLISIITIFLSSLAHAESSINRILISVEGSGKWITVRTSFYNVDSFYHKKKMALKILKILK